MVDNVMNFPGCTQDGEPGPSEEVLDALENAAIENFLNAYKAVRGQTITELYLEYDKDGEFHADLIYLDGPE